VTSGILQFLRFNFSSSVNIWCACVSAFKPVRSSPILIGVQSGGLESTPSRLPSGWRIELGYLVGPAADLTNANLTSGDLRNVNLTRANLTRANLTRANLKGAKLNRVTATKTVWKEATCPSGLQAEKHVGGTCLGVAMTAPGEVLGLAVDFPAPGKARFAWRAPTRDGNSKINRYEWCTSNCTKANSWTATKSTTAQIGRLVKGQTYQVWVRAVNAIGPGAKATRKFTQIR
jgi:hypothetical protein